MTIAVLDYGSGNLRSVEHALRRAGAHVVVTGEHDAIMHANGLVVPGVGHFGACVTALRDRSLDATIEDFVATDRPVFGVCVGMQVLYEGSEEAPDVAGLALFEGTLRRFPERATVPHMGWNRVSWLGPPQPRHPYAGADTWLYFAHSFRAPVTGATVATVRYADEAVSAAAASDNVFATQFHPERSADAGLELYRRFVEDAGR